MLGIFMFNLNLNLLVQMVATDIHDNFRFEVVSDAVRAYSISVNNTYEDSLFVGYALDSDVACEKETLGLNTIVRLSDFCNERQSDLLDLPAYYGAVASHPTYIYKVRVGQSYFLLHTDECLVHGVYVVTKPNSRKPQLKLYSTLDSSPVDFGAEDLGGLHLKSVYDIESTMQRQSFKSVVFSDLVSNLSSVESYLHLRGY
jgi:hypothetical protein